VALASGYAAYLLSYMGMRDHHGAVDVAFRSLVFSLIASSVLALTPHWGVVVSAAAAFFATLIVGVLWRRLGQRLLRLLVRSTDMTWSDDDPSALATLCSNADKRVSQIAIQLDDGTWLRCDNTSVFADAPFGPCVLGPKGDVALYLTHVETAAGDVRELTSVRDAYHGDRITYVPSERIRRMTLRYSKRS
jgi:hypothetical protein